MTCNNVKCPYYRRPTKRDLVDKMIGVKEKTGGCKFLYCKLGRSMK